MDINYYKVGNSGTTTSVSGNSDSQSTTAPTWPDSCGDAYIVIDDVYEDEAKQEAYDEFEFFIRRDPYWHLECKEQLEYQAVLFAVLIASFFNIYAAHRYRRMMFSKSGFLARAGKTRKRN